MIFRNDVLSNICLSKKKKNTDFQITDLKICVLSNNFQKTNSHCLFIVSRLGSLWSLSYFLVTS